VGCWLGVVPAPFASTQPASCGGDRLDQVLVGIGDGPALAGHALDFKTIDNAIRPHEAIGMAQPLERYRPAPTTSFPDPGSVSGS